MLDGALIQNFKFVKILCGKWIDFRLLFVEKNGQNETNYYTHK